MPNTRSGVAALVADLNRRLADVVAAARAEGRDEALGHIRSIVGGGAIPVKRGPGRPRKDGSVGVRAAKPKSRRKNSWTGLSPAARLARINAIRKGKGLAPRTE